MSEVLCTDCRHNFGYIWCGKNSNYVITIEPLTGNKYRQNTDPYSRARDNREKGPCGFDGLLFEPKFFKRLWVKLRGGAK